MWMRGRLAKGLLEIKPLFGEQSKGRESHGETRNRTQCSKITAPIRVRMTLKQTGSLWGHEEEASPCSSSGTACWRGHLEVNTRITHFLDLQTWGGES